MNTKFECRCYFVCYNLLIIIINIISYWVDNHFELYNVLLWFKKMKNFYTEVHFTEAIYNILNIYNIIKNLFYIIINNVSNNIFNFEIFSVSYIYSKGHCVKSSKISHSLHKSYHQYWCTEVFENLQSFE